MSSKKQEQAKEPRTTEELDAALEHLAESERATNAREESPV
jgi:hypothetical protein